MRCTMQGKGIAGHPIHQGQIQQDSEDPTATAKMYSVEAWFQQRGFLPRQWNDCAADRPDPGVFSRAIPQNEKVFSIFGTRLKARQVARWNSVFRSALWKVSIQFMMHHEVMWEGSDVDFAVPMVEITKEMFPDFCAASFDRGFHSPENRARLDEVLVDNVLPKKGSARLSGIANKVKPLLPCAVSTPLWSRPSTILNTVASTVFGRKVERDLPERLLWPSFP